MQLERSRWLGLALCGWVALAPLYQAPYQPTGSAGAALQMLPAALPDNMAELPMQSDAPRVISRMNHSPSLAPLAHGDMALVWYGGSREGAADVSLQWARWSASAGWSATRELLTREGLQQSLGRRVRYVGNPLLYGTADGPLHLLFVAVSLGGWAGSRLYHMISPDAGEHWSQPRLLVSSPFLNLSTLVRNRAWRREDGAWVVPAYFESVSKYPLLLVVDEAGQLLDRQRLGGRWSLLQPTLAVHDGGLVEAWMRRGGNTPRRVFYSRSTDGGQHWSRAEPSELPNSDASLAALTGTGETSWIAANPVTDDRAVLTLQRMRGRAMVGAPLVLESQAGVEYSYPALEQGSDGVTHLVYTANNRLHLKHHRWAAASSPTSSAVSIAPLSAAEPITHGTPETAPR